mmetsp:Transcript_18669/g.34588  ORF Transcript_18669/g.34588 Transcript_18669/m.34588 type:complete len:473 (-) Transcript_18669:100-1518(-)
MEGLSEEAIAWACAHGLEMVDGDHDPLVSHAPMTVLPTSLSKAAFELGVSLSQPFNELVDCIARDLEWVYATLDGVLEQDDFTRRMVELCKQVESEGVVQRTYLGINRSDYMLDGGTKLLQVELNTIASSFGCLSARVGRMHRFLLTRHKASSEVVARIGDAPDVENKLPNNTADKEIPSGIAAAAKIYRTQQNCEVTPTVLFVVQQGERNSFDQRWLEYELWDSHGIPVMRRTLAQVLEKGELVGPNRQLILEGHHIGVVYFRAGYTPDDYPSEDQWSGRLLIERSMAIKCPSIQYHLVGTKKVQQELARPGQVERFVGEEKGALLRSSFAGLWSLDAKLQVPEDKAAVQDAIANPGNYVVKPQREGGGNNLYGDEVKKALETFPPNKLASFILMKRIFPVQVPALMAKKGKTQSVEALQELGVYGVFISDGSGQPLVNEHAGHLLRTKQVGVDEGGVATGFSCIDSPWLV